MNKKIIPVLLFSTAFFSGCLERNSGASETQGAPAVKKEDAIASVNGQYISKTALENLTNEISQRSRGQQNFPQEKLIEELVQRELLVQDALQNNLDKTPDFVEQLNKVKFALLSQSSVKNFLDNNPITDEELKADYDAKSGGEKTEYKARHILLKTEDEAKQIIVELQKGADFAELAKAKSTGPSASQGGDLGWFTADRMVPPFSEGVIALEEGKFTTEPVKTKFGWHVILREDSRKQAAPPFESVKEQIRQMIQRQKLQDYINNLRNQAKVEIFLPTQEATVDNDEPHAAEASE